MPTTARSTNTSAAVPDGPTERTTLRRVAGVVDIGQPHVVRVGDFVFVSGQIGLNEDGMVVAPDDCRAQTVQCMSNLQTILRAAGAELSDVVRVVCYLVDPADASAYSDARNEFFGELPATTAVVVKELLHPDALVELEVTAALSRSA